MSTLRAYADSTFVSTPGLVVKGSLGFTFYSKSELLRLVTRGGQAPDPLFTLTPAGTTVGLLSSARAMYVRRYIEHDAEYVARGRIRPYVALKAGTLVRQGREWRLLERVNATGSTGPIDSTTTGHSWECR